MTTIWEYPLSLTDLQPVEMPRGAIVLSVDAQKGQVCLWAMVNVESPRVLRQVRIFGTGHPIDPEKLQSMDFVGTAVDATCGLVWHIWVSREA